MTTLGVIGLGRIGAFHTETLSNLAGVDGLVVADANRVLGGYLVFDRQALFLDAVIALGGALATLLGSSDL